MKTLKLMFLLLCYFLYSCDSFNNVSTYEIAIREIKKMIDNNRLDLKYVKVYKYCSNVSGDIYLLSSGYSPINIGNWMPPTKVIPYKGKYICYIDPYCSNILSKKELKSRLKNEDINDFLLECEDSESMYFIGISKNDRSFTIVYINPDLHTGIRPYIYPSLRQYIFDVSLNTNPLFIMSSYQVHVDQSFKPENSLKKHIKCLFDCEVFISETCDSVFINNIMRNPLSHFITINGRDTLKYIIQDSIENHLILKSAPCTSFFKQLPETKSTNYLDSLIRNLTYCIIERNGKYESIPVLFFDSSNYQTVRNDNSEIVMTICNEELNEWIKQDSPYPAWDKP